MHRNLSKILLRKKNYITSLLLISILILGLFLRHFDYRTIPRHGATFDEFAWTWLGINLIQKQTPISWSPQPQYQNRKEIKYQGAGFLIVNPYLEHPPLFGLVAGGFALLNGVKDMYDVTLAKIRPLALILGTFSVFMVFVFVREIYSTKLALFSSLLYASVPTVVIGSRIVQNENFLIPFWLLSLYLISRYIKSKKKLFLIISSVIAGLLSLAKIPWIVAGISIWAILILAKKYKDSFLLIAIVSVIFSMFIIYGMYFDKELFINLWKLQTARYDISFLGFFSIFTNPLLVDRFYFDGWIFFGWFSIFLLSKNFSKHLFVLAPFFTYLLMYIFAIPNEPMHGWYRYPFYPFLIIATAILLKEEFAKPSLIGILFTITVGLPLLNYTWGALFGFSFIIYRLFIIISFLSAFYFVLKRKSYSGFLTFWILLFTILNFFSVIIFKDY